MIDDTILVEVQDLEWMPHPTFAGVWVKMAQGRMAAREFSQVLIRIDPDNEIPRHTHEGLDECFYVIQGEGKALVRDERIPVQVGSSIYAPADRDHGVLNDTSEPLLLMAVFVPALD